MASHQSIAMQAIHKDINSHYPLLTLTVTNRRGNEVIIGTLGNTGHREQWF